MRKTRAALFLTLTFLFVLLAVPAAAAPGPGDGFIEIRAEVPEDFPRGEYIIVQLREADAPEDDIGDDGLFFTVLEDNDYVELADLPAGEYVVVACWVEGDFRYEVTPGASALSVKAQTTAAALPLTVTLREEGQTGSEPVTSEPSDLPSGEEPSAETSPAGETPVVSGEDPAEFGNEPAVPGEEPAAPAEEGTSRIVGRIVAGIVSSVVFIGSVLVIAYFVRKNHISKGP